MSQFDQVDLSRLPPPDVVRTLDYEVILAAVIADFRARQPGFDAFLESDPAVKLLEVVAYRELLLRQSINDGARAVMLASAQGGDLDQIAANYDVARQVVTPADPDAVPPAPAVLEDDARLRRRVQLSLESATAAGTRGRYTFYALGASPLIADVSVSAHDPTAGDVTITALSAEADWAPSAALLAEIEAALQPPDVRQLCDTVFVAAAEIVDYQVEATLTYLPGVGGELAKAGAAAALDELVAVRRLGRDVTRSAIFAALHVEGVHNVALAAPGADLVMTPKQAARCAGITLIDGGVDE